MHRGSSRYEGPDTSQTHGNTYRSLRFARGSQVLRKQHKRRPSATEAEEQRYGDGTHPIKATCHISNIDQDETAGVQ